MLAERMEDLTKAITGLTPRIEALTGRLELLETSQAVTQERLNNLQRIVFTLLGVCASIVIGWLT